MQAKHFGELSGERWLAEKALRDLQHKVNCRRPTTGDDWRAAGIEPPSCVVGPPYQTDDLVTVPLGKIYSGTGNHKEPQAWSAVVVGAVFGVALGEMLLRVFGNA